jgi:hypothetical protein
MVSELLVHKYLAKHLKLSLFPPRTLVRGCRRDPRLADGGAVLGPQADCALIAMAWTLEVHIEHVLIALAERLRYE